eukprot:jgi/Mesvir1/16444/Mv18164-RA.1
MRHLLAPTRIRLAFQIYVDDDAQGNRLVAEILANFAQALSTYFGTFVGTVQSVENVQAAYSIMSTATSDPHFVTSRGQKFDFNGEAAKTYCIITDRTLHVNARFTGAANPEATPVPASATTKPDDRTWMDQVAILVGDDRVLVGAESPPGTSYALAYGTLLVNGAAAATRDANHGFTQAAEARGNCRLLGNPSHSTIS